MAIFNVVPNGTRMKLTASISIVVSGPFIQGRGSKCRLGNNQLKIIQTDKQICIAHRNDIKPPMSTILLLALILLTRCLLGLRLRSGYGHCIDLILASTTIYSTGFSLFLLGISAVCFLSTGRTSFNLLDLTGLQPTLDPFTVTDHLSEACRGNACI